MTTINGASISLKREQAMGTVAAGKEANLVVVLDVNPIESVQNLH